MHFGQRPAPLTDGNTLLVRQFLGHGEPTSQRWCTRWGGRTPKLVVVVVVVILLLVVIIIVLLLIFFLFCFQRFASNGER